MSSIQFEFDKWEYYHWQSETRSYWAVLQQNLFGQWCIVCCWKGRYSRIGNSKTYLLSDISEAQGKIKQIMKRRLAHGYEFIPEEDNDLELD